MICETQLSLILKEKVKKTVCFGAHTMRHVRYTRFTGLLNSQSFFLFFSALNLNPELPYLNLLTLIFFFLFLIHKSAQWLARPKPGLGS